MCCTSVGVPLTPGKYAYHSQQAICGTPFKSLQACELYTVVVAYRCKLQAALFGPMMRANSVEEYSAAHRKGCAQIAQDFQSRDLSKNYQYCVRSVVAVVVLCPNRPDIPRRRHCSARAWAAGGTPYIGGRTIQNMLQEHSTFTQRVSCTISAQRADMWEWLSVRSGAVRRCMRAHGAEYTRRQRRPKKLQKHTVGLDLTKSDFDSS